MCGVLVIETDSYGRQPASYWASKLAQLARGNIRWNGSESGGHARSDARDTRMAGQGGRCWRLPSKWKHLLELRRGQLDMEYVR